MGGSPVPAFAPMIWPILQGQAPFFLSRGGPEPQALDPWAPHQGAGGNSQCLTLTSDACH